MRYNIQITGNGYVYVNGGNKVAVDDFCQTLKDVNKSLRVKYFGFGNE